MTMSTQTSTSNHMQPQTSTNIHKQSTSKLPTSTTKLATPTNFHPPVSMADKFIGNPVFVETKSGSLTGVVSKIVPGTLYLSDAVDQRSVKLGSIGLPVGEISNLQLLERTEPVPEADSAGNTKPTQHKAQNTQSNRQPNNQPSSQESAAPQREPKPSGSRPARRPKHNASSFAARDPLVEQEFDFNAALARFDKTKVMAEIEAEMGSHSGFMDQRIKHDESVLDGLPRTNRPQEPRLTSSAGAVSCATAVQLVQVEAALERSGVHPQALNAWAARGIYDACISELKSENGVIVIVAGNHRSGARAIAAGRIHASLGSSVVVVTPCEPTQVLQRELMAFTAAGGIAVASKDGFASVLRGKTVLLVVDALQGYEVPFVDQFSQQVHLHAVKWLLGWCNYQKAPKISIDQPSSFGGTDVRPCAVVSCGFPLEVVLGHNCNVYIVEFGVPHGLLKQVNMSRFCARRSLHNDHLIPCRVVQD